MTTAKMGEEETFRVEDKDQHVHEMKCKQSLNHSASHPQGAGKAQGASATQTTYVKQET